jgi:gluconolactonase
MSRFAMRQVIFLVASIAITAAAAAQQATSVLPEGAKWELVSSAGKVFGEGVVAAKDGSIYLVDLTATPKPEDNTGGAIFRYDPATGVTTTVMAPSGMANGLHVDKNGDLIIAQGAYGGKQAIAKRNLTTGAVTVLADNYQGKRFVSPNDVTSDAQGRIYFTDARFNSAEEPELPNAIYRLDPGGKLTQLSTDLLRPNGIEVSPDGKRLYVADDDVPRFKTNPHRPAADKFGVTRGGIAVYDLAPNGNISNGRLFYRNEELMPDGMAMDPDGNLYVAMNNIPNRGMVVLDPNGKVIQELPLPEKGVTVQLGFGRGNDAHTLYLATGVPWGLYRIKTLRTDFYF